MGVSIRTINYESIVMMIIIFNHMTFKNLGLIIFDELLVYSTTSFTMLSFGSIESDPVITK